jgi:uncharacterized RDD family membrane protein YckC/type II secretory pathway pseudopilin PulG
MRSVYAGFWKRFFAAAIDYALLVAVSALLGWLSAMSYEAVAGTVTVRTAEGIGNIVGILVWWVYYAALESSARQATLGKQALAIKVVDAGGGRISFARATGRHFAKIVSGLILLIGYLMAGFTARRQALHDMMAGCLVVNRAATEEEIRQAAAAPRMPGWAIALMILGVSALPLGLLAAIAIPAYQDATIKARVRAVVQAGMQATAAIDDFRHRNNAMPRDLKEAGYSAPASPAIRSMGLAPATGTVRIVLGIPALEGNSILFTPAQGSDNHITWTCGSDDIRQQRYLPANCRRN